MSLNYKQDQLFLGESGDLSEILKRNEGQACYVYDLKNIETRYVKFKDCLKGIKNLNTHYALKANANIEVLKKFKALGSKVDVVSGGELSLALKAGFQPQDIIFSGVGKSVAEIDLAIDQNIKQINVESPQELIRIGERAQRKNKKMSVAFRMNPEVNPVTHPYITTGMSENKFGMDRSFLPTLIRTLNEFSNHLYLRGLTMHIGSQLLDLESIKEAISKLISINHELEVLGFKTESLDIGGGVGIHYNKMDEDEDFKTMKFYGDTVVKALGDYQGEVMIEPGRILVGRSGVLLCQIEYIKETPYKKFVIVNTGMHHLMRPALYQAQHRILPLVKNKEAEQIVYDIVGPICESSDFIGKNRPMQKLKQGDFLAICDAGAYGFAMANNYNAHGLPKEIILK